MWLLTPVGRSTGLLRNRPLLVAAAMLAALTLLAAEALWNLRPRAFALFTLWSAAGIVMFVLGRVTTHASAHLVRFVPSILVAGIAYAGAALCLRRAL